MHLIEYEYHGEPRKAWAYLMPGFSRAGLTGQAAAEASARQLLEELRERHGDRVAVFLDGRRIRALRDKPVAVAVQSPDTAGEGSMVHLADQRAAGASSPPPPVQAAGTTSVGTI